MAERLRIEPGNDSRQEAEGGAWCTVWGYVFDSERAHAVYYVRWNDTLLEEAEFVVSVGPWGEGSGPGDRSCVAALGREHEGRLSFMLVDAARTSFADQAFLGAMCAAGDVRGRDLARAVFRILDEVLVQDDRVAVLRSRIERAALT